MTISRRSFIGSTAVVAGATALTWSSGLPTSTAWATPSLAGANPSADRPIPRFGFTHPGLLHTSADLERMRTAVAAQQSPIYDGFLAMAADTRSAYTYVVRNTGQVVTWGRGPTDYTGEAMNDSAAAYQNALMWAITGDRRHADKTRDILNIWTATLTGITGADGPLGSGLQGFKLVNAAEILRHSGYDGWAAADIAATEESFRTVWYPSISGYSLFANGNWDIAALQTVLAIGIFCNDGNIFEDAVRYAVDGAGNGRITHTLINEDGQGQESGRSQNYAQLAVGLLSAVAEVAWNQGVDLWGWATNRILAGYEYTARYNLGDDSVPFVQDLDRTGKYIKLAISATNRGQFKPIYELPFQHYHDRLGLPATSIQQVVFRGAGGARFVEGFNEDHPSWGTLTCPGAAPIGTVPAGVPAVPSGLVAAPAGRGVTLTWVPSRDPQSGVAAASYSVKRSTTIDGTYRAVATGLTSPTWTDERAKGDTIYHYVVSAVNAIGESPASLPVSLAARLPGFWQAADVGPVAGPGSARYDGQTFQIEASGRDIGGTVDDFHFVNARLGGNSTIIARVVYPLSSQYATVGVMVRDSLDPDSAHAAIAIKGLPLHTWSGVWISRASRGAASTATGSTPVPPTQAEAITVNAGFPVSNLGTLPASATPLAAPYVEGASDGFRLRKPYWVRLTRRGNKLTGAISPDGVTWTDVGSSEIRLGRSAYVGLVVCSALGVAQPYAETTTAAFDNVSVTGWQPAKPAGRTTTLRATAGASAVELAWSTLDLSSTYTVRRGERRNGSFRVLARGVTPVGFAAEIRYTDVSGTPGTEYFYRVSETNQAGEGPDSATVSAVMPQPAVPEIADSEFLANVGIPARYLLRASNDPRSFGATGLPAGLKLDAATGIISGTPKATGTVQVAVSAENAGGSGTATLTVTVTDPPPSPWSYGDVGDDVLDPRVLGSYGVVLIRRPGLTAFDAATGGYTLRGAGTGMNVIGQGFAGQFARVSKTGDGALIARLVRQEGLGSADQAGLIIAKSLNPFDHLAGVLLSRTATGPTPQFIRRLKVAGGLTTVNGAAVGSDPLWFKLGRQGLTFTASTSVDGATWTVLGSGPIDAFGDAPYLIGMVVTSGQPGRSSTAVWDNVSLA